MMRNTLIGIMLLCCTELIRGQSIPYVSPGIGISTTMNGEVVWIPKISIGILTEAWVFVNATIGMCSGDKHLGPYSFAEVQVGDITRPSGTRKWQAFLGGGVGVTFLHRGNKRRIALRSSAFFGYLLFLNINATYLDAFQMDVGGQAVLPIPLGKPDLNFVH